LNGRAVIQVAVGSYDVIFDFSLDVWISVTGQLKYFEGEREHSWKPTPQALRPGGAALRLLAAFVQKFKAGFRFQRSL